MRKVSGLQTGLVSRMDGKRELVKVFGTVRKVLLRSACAEASCYPEEYRRRKRLNKLKSPLWSHCAAVATIINVLYGGDIVTGRVKGIQHYWNRMSDGKEVDLTSCQFGGDGFTPLKKGRKVIRKGLTNIRFLFFAEKVMNVLGGV